MATIGQQLTTPEAGWRRYDDKDNRIQYIGSPWIDYADVNAWVGSFKYCDEPLNRSIFFKFRGTKLRIINCEYNTGMITNVIIKIDGT